MYDAGRFDSDAQRSGFRNPFSDSVLRPHYETEFDFRVGRSFGELKSKSKKFSENLDFLSSVPKDCDV